MAEDLDAFLTSLESKLRGPYSSLELSRIISTKSLRGGLTAREYLQSISQVLSRTDKTTYLRTIIGFLGLEPNKETDEEIYKILTDAQEPEREEWVRVVAGLARGILFVDEDGEGTRESCRGEEASRLVKKTCEEIIHETRKLERDTERKAEESANDKQSLQTTDTYPLFVSYRYSLLDPKLLDRVIPEHRENPYFQWDGTAAILAVDDDMEKARANEATDHGVLDTKPVKTEATKPGEPEKKQAIMPGLKSTSVKKIIPTKAGATRPKASMFMPAKRPGVVAGRGAARPGIPMKGTLHTRKAGAAQALLGKNRRALGSAPLGGTARLAQMGRAQKLANAKSKMKLIDVTEVRGLNKEHQQRDDKLARKENAKQRMLAKKRKILEAAAEKGLVAAPKLKELEEKVKEEDDDDDDEPGGLDMMSSNTGNGFMAFGNDDDDDDDDDDNDADDNFGKDNLNNGGDGNEQWQTILNQRSNKLSDEDRIRVQQFYTTKYNPTPDQAVYKMKLHEERTEDPATGQAVKETYYLELDYNTFTSKQSKKVKRY